MYGHVRSITDRQPVPMIEVSVQHDATVVEHTYTDTEGRYDLAVPAGDTVTVRFDTHETLNNAEDWHPSVAANVVASDKVPLDRYLLPVGHGATEASAVDALSGYLFAAGLWAQAERNAAYARTAASRLAGLKLTSRVLQEVQLRLLQHFRASA
ncbi:carboxypeptidase regulatory-like domain-containing protein [Streptomyces europaeiscabiei]|uniref:carboxypeptidase regulatory-like domain-containing protein n=1 Tax=Streptomyces europaeiscabiei TaxID=146819 RepID=UPI002E123E13|nr:carboxypeptidase-like regulatory domain-containing protein [Streptomyces europaeiscabiei]